MSKIYSRSIAREIRKSFGRFAAIIAIVALGVGFLVGILSSTPDMKTTADEYYREYAFSDYDIKSTLGFTGDDIAALSEIDEIDTIMPAKVMDLLVLVNGDEQITGRLQGTDLDNQTVNKLELLEGRMPENASECVIEEPDSHLDNISIGDVITVSSENENFDDTYASTSFEVVGIVASPYYYGNSREPSSVGTGRTAVIMYTYMDAFKTDVYTDLFILTGWKDSAFSDEYDKYIEKITDKLEVLSEERLAIRHGEIVDEAMGELQEAKDTLASEKEKAEAQFDDAEYEISRGQREYEDGLAQLDAAQKQLDDAKTQLDAVKPQIDQAKAALAAGYALPESVIAQIEQYDAAVTELEKGTAELEKSRRELAKVPGQLASARSDLRDGRRTAEKEFADAEKEIADAEAEIRDIENGEWYILDRDSNVSHARYSVDIEKVADIATLFPIFFFLIAALVSLTTMTRMVEEERIQIGTLKALGYRRITIMSKYLVYCGAATVIGCIIGLIVGYRLLPLLIFMCFGSQYSLPDLLTPFHMNYAVISCAMELICTLGATWAACHRSLNEKTAQLMTPRAPKAGKRILLERVTFLWNRLSFSYKATVRNIFRYKKHLFMTIIGVAGCTALMVAAFGIQDSLTKLAKTQFEDIQKYDMQIELTEEGSDQILEDFLSGREALTVMTCSMDMEGESNNKQINSVSVYVPEEPSQLKKFIGLQDRKSGDPVTFGDDSVVICEKMAEDLNVSEGDTITLTDPDGKARDFELTGITENYSGCYAYIAPDVYSDAFGTFGYNAYMLKSGISGTEAQENAVQQLQESEFVSTVNFTAQTKEIFDILMDSLSLLVVVLVIFAGMLAAVVLYNLTNININERIRELATLRVLGYHNKEVAAYIFREIGILTIAGTIFGLILGRLLHYYIIIVAESTDMMMGRSIDPSSYIMAALFTIVFSVLVDIAMSRKLKKIEMAASMKAID